MKNQNKIIIAAAVGGAGYLIYKNWDKISNLFKKKEEVKPVETKEVVVKDKEKTYTEYQKKVMKLQSNVGASIDGDAGSQTNKLTQAFFPNTFAKLGIVSPANIDAYLALGTKREIVDTTLENIKARGRAIWNAMSSGKKATIIRDGNVRAVYYDGVNKTYPTTGATFVLKQGGVLDKSKSVLLTDGFIVTEQFVYKSNGGNEGVRRIKVDPRILNVV
jgi:hypothetical protein